MGSQLEEQEKKERLQNIDPYDFEDFVGDLWEEEGWTTSVSQDSNDQGVDVIADKKGTIDQRLAIQAKRYSEGNKVGRPKVQQYHSLKQQDTSADAAVVVTTSGFTKDAQIWAHDHNVKLVDGDDLVDMVKKHGAHDLVEEYAPQPSGMRADEPTEPSSSTTDTTTESDADSPHVLVPISLIAQVVGMTLALAPEAVPVFPQTGALGLLLLGWFVGPIAVFLDAQELHHAEWDSPPNRIVWPGLCFVFGPLGLLGYTAARA